MMDAILTSRMENSSILLNIKTKKQPFKKFYMTWALATLNPLERKKMERENYWCHFKADKKKEKGSYIMVPSEIPNSAPTSKYVFQCCSSESVCIVFLKHLQNTLTFLHSALESY